MKLWLDDIRKPPHGEKWVWFTSPWSAISFVVCNGNDVDEWSLDHDLGENIPTGYSFLSLVEAMIAKGYPVHVPETVKIHSANPVGRRVMQATLDSIRRFQDE